MDIEYHYYITYLIAIVSGFTISEAYKIAYSSQYVDDNYTSLHIYNSKKQDYKYKNIISAIKECSLDIKKIERILTSFHFIPGCRINNRKDGKTHILSTTKNNKLAKMALRKALNSQNLYQLGIASHAYVDTWAHQNFVGTLSDFNAFSTTIGKLLPNIGHIDALDKPDLVGLIWQDPRLKKSKIDNISRFLDASKKLITEYIRYTNGSKINTDKFLYNLKEIMKNGTKNSYIDVKRLQHKRLKQYNELAKEYTSFDILKYDKNHWYNDAIKLMYSGRLYWKKHENYKDYKWYKFQEAIKAYNKTYLAIK